MITLSALLTKYGAQATQFVYKQTKLQLIYSMDLIK